jgi:hypothetical protein
MSQKAISQVNVIERTCEGCEKVFTFTFDAVRVNQRQETREEQATLDEMSSWYTVVREVLNPESGQFVKLMAQACSLACVGHAAMKLAEAAKMAEAQAQQGDDIDLSRLKVN